MKDKLKNIKWTSVLAFAIWAYLIVKFGAVRNMLIGIFKWLFYIWCAIFGLFISMIIFAIVAFVIMIIGVKLGVIDSNALNSRLKFKK